MRHLIFSFIILVSQGLVSGCSTRGFELPEEWTRDFTIDLYSGGGMQDRSISINYTYDSCKYIDRNGSNLKINAFAMTATDRKEVLKKMHELRADQIRSVKDKDITLDKESTQLCFQYKTEFCLVDGAASGIQEDDQQKFSDAYRYLNHFAMRKN